MAANTQTGMSDATVRAFGLGHSGLTVSEGKPEKESEQTEERESEEANEPDASQSETVAKESTQEESEEAEGEDADRKKAEPKVEDADKRAKEAEQRERKLQSRLDKQTALYERQVREIQEQFERFKTTVQQRTVDDGLKPDDLVDKKTVERLVREAMGQSTPQQKTNGPTFDQQRHIEAHPDYDDVNAYWAQIKDSDQSIASIPTDLVGAFYAIQAKRLQATVEKMQKDQKAEIDKAIAAERKKLGSRPKIPPTGGNGNRREKDSGSDRVVEEMTATERMFANFFDKKAGGKTRVVQVQR